MGALAPGWEGVGKSDPAGGSSGARWLISVLQGLGGKAILPQIYAKAEGRRPTPNVWRREKIRQMLCTTTDIYENDGLWCHSPAI